MSEPTKGFWCHTKAEVQKLGTEYAETLYGKGNVHEYGEDKYGETHFRNDQKEKVATLKKDGLDSGYYMHVYHTPIRDEIALKYKSSKHRI